jgi:DNA-binding transcriptional ArsR family regulator
MKIDSHCSGCFAGLSCGARIEIINLLQQKGEMSVLEIAKEFALTQPTVTHHLQYLEKAGILASRKEGRKVFYSLHPKCDQNICKLFS